MRMTVLDHVLLDHTYLRTQLERLRLVQDEPVPRARVAALLEEVVRHETAESTLLRPVTRQLRGGAAVAACLDGQEEVVAGAVWEVEAALSRGDDDAVPALLEALRGMLLDHLDTEEHTEHPRVRGACDRTELERLGAAYLRTSRLEIDLTDEDDLSTVRATLMGTAQD